MSDDKMFDIKDEIEELIVIGIDTKYEDVNQNLLELEELIITSGAKVLGSMTQSLERPNPKSYFNSGKLEELKDLISLHDATGIVCDDELSSNQLRFMSDFLNVKIMDRTMVILDIFAKRALSSEGIAQVELAQLKYNSARLIGLGLSLSRQGGGIGSKGPGEKKLETDRREIKDRIVELESEINQIKIQRKTQREQRVKKGIEIVSMVGYTNSGKSTLMNYLTDANVLSEDKLFATLDTTTRKLELPSSEVLFTDTVGFINKLPHTLIQAFNATLEELLYADLLIHVVDVSNDNYIDQINLVYETLKDLGANDKPVITVLNKVDLISKDVDIIYKDRRAIETIQISAQDGTNTDVLLIKIQEVLNSFKEEIHLLIPFSDGDMLSLLHKEGNIISETHTEKGTEVKAIVNVKLKNQMDKYKI